MRFLIIITVLTLIAMPVIAQYGSPISSPDSNPSSITPSGAAGSVR